MTRPSILMPLLCLSASLEAKALLCEAETAVSIDHYKTMSSADESEPLKLYSWIVDVDRGWRRSDSTGFNGSCDLDDGYVVCRSTDISYGEATFSIHPDGAKFTLVFTDYGLGSLTFVGTCTES